MRPEVAKYKVYTQHMRTRTHVLTPKHVHTLPAVQWQMQHELDCKVYRNAYSCTVGESNLILARHYTPSAITIRQSKLLFVDTKGYSG